MKYNNKIEESKRIEILKKTIWFNLLIGVYNLFVYTSMNSYFHLILGSLNIGVWVFYRERLLNFSFTKKIFSHKKHSKSI